MALIKCNECKKDVSDTAVVCPYCGYQIKTYQTGKKSKMIFFLGLLSMIIGFLALMGKQPNVAIPFIVLGFFLFVIGKIGIWWTRG